MLEEEFKFKSYQERITYGYYYAAALVIVGGITERAIEIAQEMILEDRENDEI